MDYDGWIIKPANELAKGDSVCSLGPVEEISGPDEDGFLVVAFGPLSALAMAAEDAGALRPLPRWPRLIWSPTDPVVVLAPEAVR